MERRYKALIFPSSLRSLRLCGEKSYNAISTCADPASGDTIKINGTKGSISWSKEAQPYENKEEYAPESTGEIGSNIIEDMILAIEKGVKPNVDGHEGRKSVELVEAIYTSSETGKLIPLKYQ